MSDASVVRRIYSIKRRDGAWDDSIEDYFMRLEGDALPILEKMVAGAIPTKREKCIFGLYIARQMQRGLFVADFAEREAAKFQQPAFVLEFIEANRNDLIARHGDETIQHAIRDLKATPRGLDIDPKTYLRFLIPATPPYAATIADLHWRLEKAKGHSFVTSDNPTCVRRRGHPTDPYVVGLNRPDAELYFPLNRTTVLIASKDKQRGWTRPVGALRVREINRITVINAFRFIFASERNPVLESLIAEHKDDRVRFPEMPLHIGG